MLKTATELADGARLYNSAAESGRIINSEAKNKTHPLGVVGTKAQAVAGASNIKMESFSADDVKVRVYGDAAVVTGRATVKGQLKAAADTAQDISGRYRYTRVYVKQQGQWRLASFQFAPIRQLPAQ